MVELVVGQVHTRDSCKSVPEEIVSVGWLDMAFEFLAHLLNTGIFNVGELQVIEAAHDHFEEQGQLPLTWIANKCYDQGFLKATLAAMSSR